MEVSTPTSSNEASVSCRHYEKVIKTEADGEQRLSGDSRAAAMRSLGKGIPVKD